MSAADFNELLKRYLNDTLSADELHQILAWLQQQQNTEVLKQAIEQALRDRSFGDLPDSTRADLIFQKILKQAEEGPPLADDQPKSKPITWIRWLAAAAVLTALITGVYYMKPKTKPAVPSPVMVTDVAPGGNKAILTLADGSTITLDDATNGWLTQQGATKVEKSADGQLSYTAGAATATEILYNTISTPRGGQYHIILPDGSKVWMNAASSLRFPTAFPGHERKVELTGEAYFEVAKSNIPFRMQVNNRAAIEVLGTHFNVNAYENEQSLNATLLEGSIKVTGAHEAVLKPGQQAAIAKNAQLTINNNIDPDHVLAWKNGLFQFNSDNIQTIMRQIERWYDVEVYYKGPIPDGHYSGVVPRANNLQKVLRILEESDLKFTLQGKKLLVL